MSVSKGLENIMAPVFSIAISSVLGDTGPIASKFQEKIISNFKIYTQMIK